MVRPVVELSRAADRAQAGDFDSRAEPGGGGETRALALTFNAILERLGNEASRVRAAAGSAAEVSVAAEQLATATSEQMEVATEAVAGMESLAISCTEIVDSVADVAAKADALCANIQRANTDLQASTDRTLANAKRVNEIQGVLELINDIADQTSLLALNAAIEAARAGDAGRGFAIVADEVRRMAERSKAAAAQIDKLVEGAQETSAEAFLAIEKRGKQLDDWMNVARALAEKSQQVQPAAKQHQVDTDTIKQSIQLIAEGFRSTAVTAQQIASAASDQALIPTDVDLTELETTR
jgi:methyl-accepting chemotaxis protein